MVKKASILEKLRQRFSSSPVRVSTPESTKSSRPAPRNRVAAATNPEPARTAPREPVVEPPEEPSGEVVQARPRPVATPSSARKIGRQEEAQLTLERGLADLAGLLRGLHDRLEGPSAQLAKLPDLSRAQLEALRGLAERLDRQEIAHNRVADHLNALPETLTGVREALERAAATDARTASTLTEFKTDMAQIQDAMGDLVQSGKLQAESAAKTARNNDVAGEVADVNRKGLEALRAAQADQAGRLAQIAQESKTSQRLTVAILGGVLVTLIVIAAVLVAG